MSRYLLDTNILVFMVTGETDEISRDVKNILEDYNNRLEASSISFAELIQLHRIGKIRLDKGRTIKDAIDTLINEIGIYLMPFTDKHVQTLSDFQVIDSHNDPFDHAIISQAITDKLTLISSDRKFKDYQTQNLKFIFNKR